MSCLQIDMLCYCNCYIAAADARGYIFLWDIKKVGDFPHESALSHKSFRRKYFMADPTDLHIIIYSGQGYRESFSFIPNIFLALTAIP